MIYLSFDALFSLTLCFILLPFSIFPSSLSALSLSHSLYHPPPPLRVSPTSCCPHIGASVLRPCYIIPPSTPPSTLYNPSVPPFSRSSYPTCVPSFQTLPHASYLGYSLFDRYFSHNNFQLLVRATNIVTQIKSKSNRNIISLSM